MKTIYLPNMIFLFLSSEQSVVCLSACVKADFQSSHEAPRSSLRVLASN